MAETRTGLVGAGEFAVELARRAASVGTVVVFDTDDRRLAVARAQLASTPEVRVTGAIGDLHDRNFVIDATGSDATSASITAARLGVSCEPRALFATVVHEAPAGPIGAASGRPGRWIGLHPVALREGLPLLEMVRGPASTPATVQAWRRLFGRLGLRTVVSPDRPGFLVQRVLFPALDAVARLVDVEGADAHEVAAALRLGAGWTTNPFDLLGALRPGMVGATLASWGQPATAPRPTPQGRASEPPRPAAVG